MHHLSRRIVSGGRSGVRTCLTSSIRQRNLPQCTVSTYRLYSGSSSASGDNAVAFEKKTETKTKQSKRGAKKAAFGSQKGVDITTRAHNYSAW